MLRITVITAFVLLAAAAPAAQAKEVMGLSVCGADGCTKVRDRALLTNHAVVDGGPPVAAPTRAEPYVELRFAVGDGKEVMERFSTVLLPEAGLLRGMDGTWMRMNSEGLALLRGVTAGVEPHPAAGLTLPEPPAPAREPAPAGDDGGTLPDWLLALGAAVLLATVTVLPRLRRRAAPGT